MVFDRFADYWDVDSPGNVSQIVFTPIKEAPTRVAALLSGDIDFAAPIPPTDLDRIDSSDAVDLVTMSGTRIITFQLNQERVPQFADVRVRQAIVYAINNAGIVEKIMKNFGTAAAQQSKETYRMTLGRQPGHWMGSFSHCISLFPGEQRSFKLLTEQKIETEQ